MLKNNRKQYFIYSPATQQAQAIAYFLNKYVPNAHITGVFLAGETKKKLTGIFNELVIENEIKNKAGIYVPTSAKSTEKLLKKQEILLGEVRMSKAALQVYDKITFLQVCEEVKIPIPETWMKFEEVEQYPVYYKPKYEKGGGSRGIAFSPEDVPEDERKLLIYQEIIESSGTYGVSFVAENGELLVSHCHFERVSMPEKGGSAVVLEQFDNERLIQSTKSLIHNLKYSGWGLAEFKYCPKRDNFVAMEINAKFWASCEFTFLNEPKFLKYLFNIISEEKAIRKMVFVNQALKRGFGILKNSGAFSGAERYRVYSGWGESILIGFLPERIYVSLQSTYRKIKKVRA